MAYAATLTWKGENFLFVSPDGKTYWEVNRYPRTHEEAAALPPGSERTMRRMLNLRQARDLAAKLLALSPEDRYRALAVKVQGSAATSKTQPTK